MNPTALKLAADRVASDPTLQIDGGIGLVVIVVCVVLLALLVLYSRGYQRGEDT